MIIASGIVKMDKFFYRIDTDIVCYKNNKMRRQLPRLTLDNSISN